MIVVVGGFSTLGRLIVTRAGNVLGWVFLVMGAALALGLPAEGYLDVAFREPYVASLPGTEVAGLLANAFPAVMAYSIPMLFLLFPTGSPPTPRWRWVIWAWLTGTILSGIWLLFRPVSVYAEPGRYRIPNPLGLEFLRPLQPLLLNVGVAIVLASAVAAVVSLVVRFRRARGEERQQITWLLLVAIVAALLMLTMFVLDLFGIGEDSDVLWISLLMVLVLGIPAATALAIFRYRLYDVDVVVSKTIAYAGLATRDRPRLRRDRDRAGCADRRRKSRSGAAARRRDPRRDRRTAGLVALQPAREPDRLRRTIHAVPGDGRVRGSDRADPVGRPAAPGHGGGGGARRRRARRSRPDVPARPGGRRPGPVGDVAVGGSTSASPTSRCRSSTPARRSGISSVAKSPGDPLRPTERTLLEDLAAHAGIGLENARLSVDLEQRAEELSAQTEELRRSRERLVTVRDAQRHRLEQELRDGVGAEIAAIRDEIRDDAERVVADPDGVANVPRAAERTRDRRA